MRSGWATLRLMVVALTLILAACSLSSLLVAQVTPNIGLNIPNFNAPNWNVPLNQNFSMLDSYLSGITALPGLKLSGNLTLGTFTGCLTATAGVVSSTGSGCGVGTLTGITTASPSGLIGGGTSGTLSLSLLTSCAANQVLQWSGSVWACATISAGLSGMTANQIPLAASASTITSSKPLQGTDANILTSSTVSGTSAILCTDSNGGATTSSCPSGNGLSGMTAAQVPIAATATTVTSSEPLAGSGAGIVTGPVSGTTAGHVVTEVGTTGQIQDSGTLLSSLGTVLSVTGTTDEISVATGTTTPVLSIPPIFIAPGSVTATSGLTSTSDGVHAGILSLPGNTTNPVIPSNTFGWLGPASASFTSYFLQPSSAAPSGTQYLACSTPSLNVSSCPWTSAPGSIGYNSGSISASVGATNIASAANFPTGQYLLSCDVVVTAVGSSPTLATTVGWTDISGTARTKTCTTGVVSISDNPFTTSITSNGSAAITITQTLAVSTATWQTTVAITRLQ